MDETLEVIKRAEKYRREELNVEKAIETIEKYIEDIEQNSIVLTYEIPMLLDYLGSFYRDKGDTTMARKMYERGLELAINDLNKIDETKLLVSLAFLELKAGDIKKAMKYTNRALEFIAVKREDKFAEAKANTYAVLGNIFFEEGSLDKAQKSYRRALEIARKIAFLKREVTLVGDIANVYIAKKDYLRAQKYLEENIEKAKESNILAVPQFYLRLGKVLAGKGDKEKAEKKYREALRFAQENSLVRDIGECYEALGDLLSSSDDYQNALEWFSKGNYSPKIDEIKAKLKAASC